ncbi:hypothetical protein ABPG72_021034 [Tetrahymena utriculariae]
MEKIFCNRQRERLVLQYYRNNTNIRGQPCYLSYQGFGTDSHNSSTLNLKQEEQQSQSHVLKPHQEIYQQMTSIKLESQYINQISPLEQPSNSVSIPSQVKFEDTRGLTSDQQNNYESPYNNLISSNNSNKFESEQEVQVSDTQKQSHAPQKNLQIKKTSKKKSGRPLKRNFAIAEKQKLMKEYDVEDDYGSVFSSENFQLLVTAFIVFGQDNCNSNQYIVKKSSDGEKNLDLFQKIGQHQAVESKRMWLNYYKISKILNANSKSLMRQLWEIFEISLRHLESQLRDKQSQQNGQISIQFYQYLQDKLQNTQSLQSLFNSYEGLSLILKDPQYFSFTQQCFDPMNYQKEKEQKNEDKQIEYQDIEKTLLIKNNITKHDFIYILFSCAVCDYSNIISPYYKIICNLL